jgi:hypothetical protein
MSRVIESATVEAVLVLEVTCDHCQREPRPDPGDVFMEMQPGRDGAPWYLCAACWFDGLFPKNPRGMTPSRVVEVSG